MRNETNDLGRDLETGAIKAIAIASKTPFRTAFKVTMGIALARLASFSIFLMGASGLYMIIKYLAG